MIKHFFLNDEIISDLLLLNPKINNIDEFPNKLIVKPLALDRLIIFTKSFFFHFIKYFQWQFKSVRFFHKMVDKRDFFKIINLYFIAVDKSLHLTPSANINSGTPLYSTLFCRNTCEILFSIMIMISSTFHQFDSE